MRGMNQSGVGVRTMSHNHEKNESDWSRCENYESYL